MKVGDYVRTKDGIIDKVIIDYNGHCASPSCNCKHVSCEKDYYDEDKIIKSSPNIIDLIEVGDYVNGYKVTSKDQYLGFGNHDWYMREDEIKSIVTREQFESMEYRIGE